MTNITPIYWEANGLSLHTWAWAIETFGGGRYTPANKRGEDLQVPLGVGRIPLKKTREARTLPLQMWLRPLSQDGVDDPALTPEQQLHDNWNLLMSKLSVDGQFPLVKRWYEGATVKSATAMAEVLDFPEPNSQGYLQKFTVDFYLANPFFYGADIVVAAGAITVQGYEVTRRVTFDMTVTGPGRVDMSDGNWFEYDGAAGNLVVNSETGLATLGGLPVNGKMSRNFDFWQYAEFKPGSLTVTPSGGITSCNITYAPAYW